MTKPKIQVNIRNYQRRWHTDARTIAEFLQKTWSLLVDRKKLPHVRELRPRGRDTEVTVVFLNDIQMQCYNKAYRKKDYPTDVLSFPVNQNLEGQHYLGDILISLQTTERQAKEKRLSAGRELQILLIHGMLHLLGYDHETDSGEMEKLEKQLRLVILIRNSPHSLLRLRSNSRLNG